MNFYVHLNLYLSVDCIFFMLYSLYFKNIGFDIISLVVGKLLLFKGIFIFIMLTFYIIWTENHLCLLGFKAYE